MKFGVVLNLIIRKYTLDCFLKTLLADMSANEGWAVGVPVYPQSSK